MGRREDSRRRNRVKALIDLVRNGKPIAISKVKQHGVFEEVKQALAEQGIPLLVEEEAEAPTAAPLAPTQVEAKEAAPPAPPDAEPTELLDDLLSWDEDIAFIWAMSASLGLELSLDASVPVPRRLHHHQDRQRLG